MAIRVEPYKKRQSRQVITKASKYYMFDVGVAGYLTKRHIVEQKGGEFGKAFEHFLLNEKEKRMHGKIAIIPWEVFLYELWSGKIL